MITMCHVDQTRHLSYCTGIAHPTASVQQALSLIQLDPDLTPAQVTLLFVWLLASEATGYLVMTNYIRLLYTTTPWTLLENIFVLNCACQYYHPVTLTVS
jgi:isoleucyl-tRNA synthetase